MDDEPSPKDALEMAGAIISFSRSLSSDPDAIYNALGIARALAYNGKAWPDLLIEGH